MSGSLTPCRQLRPSSRREHVSASNSHVMGGNNKRKESRRSDDEFFTMISRRVREMSPTTQRWVEDQIWDIYRQARRREEVGAVASMQNATFTQSFRSLQPYSPEPTQRQQQPSTSNTGNEVSAADIIAMSFDMCNE